MKLRAIEPPSWAAVCANGGGDGFRSHAALGREDFHHGGAWFAMKILALTNLFPSVVRPRNGLFLKHRLQHLGRLPGANLRVLAPVPWFPFKAKVFGSYAKLAQTPCEDDSTGIRARFVRYPMLPKISMWLTPFSIAFSALWAIRSIKRSGFDPDVIDAYYLYPDGVAACLVGLCLRKPVMLTALGTDVSQIARRAIPGAMIRWAARRAIAVTALCQALVDQLIGCGVAPEKLSVVEHGVDPDMFRPSESRAALRRALALRRFSIISVGHLLPNKGHHLAIRAVAEIPDAELMIVGDGTERTRLTALANELGMAGRVVFTGSIDQERLATLLQAADLLVSCSEYEGISNVLLEALSCGTPVAATPVWGSPEVITDDPIGLLFRERSSAAIADGIRAAMARSWDRSFIRRYSLRYDWQRTADQHYAIMCRSLGLLEPADPAKLTSERTIGERAQTA
ncbi:glycosyltransferase [Rhizorhabdus histidinilytica]|uniref:glycosyltransferase n=1 Tax=Rhizorhabdus histidinilytica TaxID=439228 RepID=UPI00322047CA